MTVSTNTIIETIDVKATIDDCYAAWSDFARFPEFMSAVENVEMLDATTSRWKTSIGGVDRTFTAKLVEDIPGARIAWESTSGPKQTGVVTFHDLSQGETRIAYQMEVDPDGFAETAAAILGLVSTQVKADLSHFKTRVEEAATVLA